MSAKNQNESNGLMKDEWDETLEIRGLIPKEIPDALALAWIVFSEYEAPEYSREGIEEFQNCLQDGKYLNGIEYYGAFIGNALIGMLGIRKENAHICFFFVKGEYHRHGIGTRLFHEMQKNFPEQEITLNASPFGMPFYRALGFIPTGSEQTVNGIRFTPMILNAHSSAYKIIKLSERRDLKDKAASWFSEKWSVPKTAYLESIQSSFSSDTPIPSWYLCLDRGKIIAGMGVIQNDFHSRKDLTPNVCAVFTEPDYRKQGIAGKLLNYVCNDMAEHGINILYLLTDHTGFYERYGWKFYCMVQGDGEEQASRMYIHRVQ